MMCQQPDRHVPGMKCGYPLPCPHHTLVLDPGAGTITEPVQANLNRNARIRLKALTATLHEIASVGLSVKPKKKRKKR